MSVDSQWLSVHDIAELLQIKDETVRRWIRRRELAVLELGGPRSGYRIRREDVDHFIWQRYRMRNQNQEDREFRQDFNLSDERVLGNRSIRISSDSSGSIVANDPDVRESPDAQGGHAIDSQYLSLIRRIPGITYLSSSSTQSEALLSRTFAFVSTDFERILGVPAAELRNNDNLWWDRVPHEDLGRIRKAQLQSFATGNRLSLEYRVIDRNQKVCWVREEAVMGEDTEDGNALWQGIILNISDRKAIEEALRTRSDQQAAIVELGELALNDMNLASLMNEAVTFVKNSLAVDLTKVLQLQPGGESLLMRAGDGWEPDAVNRAMVSAGAESQAGYTLLSNEPVIVYDLRTEERFNGPPLLHNHGVRSGISVIIAGSGMPWGVLGAHTTTLRRFTYEDVHFLQSVANILASAIRAESGATQDGPWLSIRNVADSLRVKEETVRRWIRRGELPVIDLGSSRAGYRIHPADLEQFIGDRYMANQQPAAEN